MKSRTKNTLEFVQMLQEVVNGKRGFVSVTEEAKKRGMDKKRLSIIAENMGLAVAPHGRYGFCAKRR